MSHSSPFQISLGLLSLSMLASLSQASDTNAMTQAISLSETNTVQMAQLHKEIEASLRTYLTTCFELSPMLPNAMEDRYAFSTGGSGTNSVVVMSYNRGSLETPIFAGQPVNVSGMGLDPADPRVAKFEAFLYSSKDGKSVELPLEEQHQIVDLIQWTFAACNISEQEGDGAFAHEGQIGSATDMALALLEDVSQQNRGTLAGLGTPLNAEHLFKEAYKNLLAREARERELIDQKATRDETRLHGDPNSH